MKTLKQNPNWLSGMRSFSRRAWLLHGVLMASLILGPSPVGHAVPVRSYDVLDSNNQVTETRQYEDWNENEVHDPGEKNWIYDTLDGDGDGLVDAREVVWGTDPQNLDSDYDGIRDGDEIDLLGGPSVGYDPLLWDTDQDGYSDHDEYYSYFRVDYRGPNGAGSSYFDWDGDGHKNPEDSHPFDVALFHDWNGNGTNDDQNSDGDASPDDTDSHPFDPNLWSDWNGNNINDYQESIDTDGDGRPDLNDSHPSNPNLWSDWNINGVNDELEMDSDGDGRLDHRDSHPFDPSLWNDWNSDGMDDDADHDGHNNEFDSHPTDPNLWHDWNGNGFNDEIETVDTDGDTVPDYLDSHPNNPNLWSDRNGNGVNDEVDDDDLDTYVNSVDSHPGNRNLYTDWDNDGLNEDQEVALGTEINDPDTDGDGLNDGNEQLIIHTDPKDVDTDDDGLTDFEEVVIYSHLRVNNIKLSPLNKHTWHEYYTDYQLIDDTDTDGDGIPDRIESVYAAMDPLDPTDGNGDLDADYVTNFQEYLNGTCFDGGISVYDADGDGLSNVQEDYYLTILNKSQSTDATVDFDGDGLLNFEELQVGLHPGLCDTVGNIPGPYGHWQTSGSAPVFIVDRPEATVAGKSADLLRASYSGMPEIVMPLSPGDADNDQIPDRWEHYYRKNPAGQVLGLHLRKLADAQQDPDQDGLINLGEYAAGTNPYLANTDANGPTDADDDFDGDGFSNLIEFISGTDPKVPQSHFTPTIAAPLPTGTTVNKKMLAGESGTEIGVTEIYEIYKEYVLEDRNSTASQTLPPAWCPGMSVMARTDPAFQEPGGPGEGGTPQEPVDEVKDPDAPVAPGDKRRVAFIGVRVRYSGSLIAAGYTQGSPVEFKVKVVSRNAAGSIVMNSIQSLFV